MADKIIIEVGLDNADYAKKANETLKAIQDLKDQQTILAATGKKNSLEFEQNKVKLQQLGRELKANVTLSNNYTGSINGMRAQLSVLNAEWAKLSQEQRENTDEGKALADQMLSLTTKLKEQEKGVGDTRRNVGNYTEGLDELKGSLLDAAKAHGPLTDVIEKVRVGYEFGNKAIDDAGKAIQAYRQSQEEVKQTQEAYEKAQTIATKATEAAAEAEKKATEIGFKFGQGTATKQEVIKATTIAQEAATTAQEANVAVTQAATAAQNANTAAVGLGATALKVLKIALLSTGIGALIVAAGALLSYLSKYQPVIDKIKVATAGLSAGFETLGKIIYSFFTGGNTAELMKNFTKNISDAAKEAAKLQAAENKLARDRANNAAMNKQFLLDEEKLKNIRDNELNSLAERKKANDGIIDLERKRLKMMEDDAKKEAAIAKGRILSSAGVKNATEEQFKTLRESGKVSLDLLEKYSAAELKLADVREESAGRENEYITNNYQLKKEAFDKSQELKEKEKEILKEEQESILRANEFLLSERQKEVQAVNKQIDEKIALYKKYNRLTVQLEQERTERLRQIQEKFYNEDQETIRENNRKVLDLLIANIADQGLREIAQLQVNSNRRLEDQNKLISALKKRAKEGNEDLTALIESELEVRAAIVENNSRQMFEKTQELDQERLDQVKQNELDIIQARMNGADTEADRLQNKQDYLDLEYEMAMDAAVRQGQDTFVIQEEFAAKQKELENEKWAAATNAVGEFSDAFQDAVGRNTKAAQLAAALQAKAEAALFLKQKARLAIEQLLGITSQLKQPFPLNVVAVAGTLALVAKVAAAAKTLVTVPNYNTGGLHYHSDGKGAVLSGPGTGTSDSMNARLSNGEVVINEKSSKMFLPILSAINTAGGGRPLVGPGSRGYKSVLLPHLNEGGMFQAATSTYVNQSIDTASLAAAIASQMKNVTIVTDVRDITSAQQRRAASNNNQII